MTVSSCPICYQELKDYTVNRCSCGWLHDINLKGENYSSLNGCADYEYRAAWFSANRPRGIQARALVEESLQARRILHQAILESRRRGSGVRLIGMEIQAPNDKRRDV